MYIISKYWKPKQYIQAEHVKKKEKHFEFKKTQLYEKILSTLFLF